MGEASAQQTLNPSLSVESHSEHSLAYGSGINDLSASRALCPTVSTSFG